MFSSRHTVRRFAANAYSEPERQRKKKRKRERVESHDIKVAVQPCGHSGHERCAHKRADRQAHARKHTTVAANVRQLWTIGLATPPSSPPSPVSRYPVRDHRAAAARGRGHADRPRADKERRRETSSSSVYTLDRVPLPKCGMSRPHFPRGRERASRQISVFLTRSIGTDAR